MEPVTLIAYGVAVAIPAFTLYLFVMLDIFGTGKVSTIGMSFVWGAVGAFGLAYVINSFFLDLGLRYATLTGFVAPLVEEPLKAAFLLYLIRSPRFRYVVDGAVYGIAVGIGFAMSENMFVYLPDAGESVLGVALSRTLSTSLVHAAASGIVGITLGRVRRMSTTRRNLVPLFGLIVAIVLHATYNNLARELEGLSLLLIAVGMGIGGGVVIGWQIGQGLKDEKSRFTGTLGLEQDNFGGERKAVQQLGGARIETVFRELSAVFSAEELNGIRRLLVAQGNIGILRNNLNSPASERLRDAWREEIRELEQEVVQLRKALGPRVNLYMRRVFPVDDQAMQDAVNAELSQLDPTSVHQFDMFMRMSGLAESFTPEELVARAERLSRIDIFSNVTLANLENLSRAIKVQEFAPGEVLFNAGDAGSAMYLIEEGCVEIYVPHAGPDAKPLRVFEAGKVVGEFSLLDGEPRSARAQAAGHVRTLMLKRDEFLLFIQSRPQVVLAMLQYLADKARHTTTAVETAVDAMVKIGRGEYEKVSAAQSAPAMAPTAVSEPVVAAEAVPVTLEPEAMTPEARTLVSGFFSSAAQELQRRERAMRDRLESSGA